MGVGDGRPTRTPGSLGRLRHGDTGGAGVAEYAGSAPTYSAEHLGSRPAELETTDGLAAAMGGFAVHPLLFAGAEVMAQVNSNGNALNLNESWWSSSSPTPWVSHPSGIGYRRSVPASSGSGGGSESGSGCGGSPGIPGNAPITDSGTADGSNDQELARLANFDTGGNENPTSTQTAPTSRAEQQAGVAMAAVFGGGVGFGRGAGNSDSSSSNGQQGGSAPGDGGDPDAGNPWGDGGPDDDGDPDGSGDPDGGGYGGGNFVGIGNLNDVGFYPIIVPIGEGPSGAPVDTGPYPSKYVFVRPNHPCRAR
jgi:hypothetical protein